MNALGNFLLGSYATGFLFMMFFIEQISGEPPDVMDRANIGLRILAGFLWPVAAVCFFFVRLDLFFSGK